MAIKHFSFGLFPVGTLPLKDFLVSQDTFILNDEKMDEKLKFNCMNHSIYEYILLIFFFLVPHWISAS